MLFFASFTEAGVPKTGLSPTIDIWEDDGSQVVTAQAMTEIAGGHYLYNYAAYDDTKDYVATADGTATLANQDRYKLGTNAVQAGTDAAEDNVRGADSDDLKDISDEIAAVQSGTDDILIDTAEIQGKLPVNNIADETLQQTSHTTTQADIAALNDLSQTDVRSAMTAQGYTTALAALLVTVSADTVLTRKYNENRMEWDFTTSPVTMTLYDDDGTTPLQTHEMKTNADGAPTLIPTVQTKRSASTI